MIRRALLLLAIAGVYVAMKRYSATPPQSSVDRAAVSTWANEGGANV